MAFKNLLNEQTSVIEFDKNVYASSYNSKDAIRSSNACYQAFPQDIEDRKTYSKLTMPVIGIGGSGYEILKMSLTNTATNLQLRKVESSGHFILVEKPNETAKFIMEFLGSCYLLKL